MPPSRLHVVTEALLQLLHHPSTARDRAEDDEIAGELSDAIAESDEMAKTAARRDAGVASSRTAGAAEVLRGDPAPREATRRGRGGGHGLGHEGQHRPDNRGD